jgi:hypothetical protein
LTSSNESGLPRRFRQTSYAVLEIRDGGGIMMLFGLPFLLAGAAIVAPFSGLLPLQLAPDGKWTQFGFVLMGLAFVIVGTVFVFGRQWLTIDLSRGLVVVQYGVLVPMRTRQRSLSEFSGVSLRRVRGDSESVDRFPVQFHARTGHHFTISRPSNFGEARQQAEYLARWLRLPLTDETTDRGTTVAAQHAGDSLRERFQAETAEAAAPQPPQRMRSQVFESDREVKIVIPGKATYWPELWLFSFAPVMLRVFFPALRRLWPNGTRAPLSPQVLLLGIFIVPMTLLLVALIASRRRRTIVKASPAGLEIELSTPWRVPAKILPVDQIVDVDFSSFEGTLLAVKRLYAPEGSTVDPPRGVWGFLAKRIRGDGIIVKSKQDWINFGEQLPADELRYLAWLLRRALAGSRK